MSCGYSNKVFMCPYFAWDERLAIHCEGGCASFADRVSAEIYADKFCANITGWNRCTLASARTEYYDRRDRDEKRR